MAWPNTAVNRAGLAQVKPELNVTIIPTRDAEGFFDQTSLQGMILHIETKCHMYVNLMSMLRGMAITDQLASLPPLEWFL